MRQSRIQAGASMKRRPSKRTDWKAKAEQCSKLWVEAQNHAVDLQEKCKKLLSERNTLLDTIFELHLENNALREDHKRLEREKEFWAKRAEFNGELCDKAQARVHSLLIENEQQNVNILAQQKKLIELRGKPEERISC